MHTATVNLTGKTGQTNTPQPVSTSSRVYCGIYKYMLLLTVLVSISASYLGGPWLESCVKSWLSSFPPAKCRGRILKTGHDHFLPHPFLFT